VHTTVSKIRALGGDAATRVAAGWSALRAADAADYELACETFDRDVRRFEDRLSEWQKHVAHSRRTYTHASTGRLAMILLGRLCDPNRPRPPDPDGERWRRWVRRAVRLLAAGVFAGALAWLCHTPAWWCVALAPVVVAATTLVALMVRGSGQHARADAEAVRRRRILAAALGVLRRQIVADDADGDLAGARVIDSAIDEHGWRIDVAARPGVVITTLGALADRIATHYRAGAGTVTVTTLKAAGHYRVSRTLISPFVATPWPGPATTTCRDRIAIALTADRAPLSVPTDRHTLIAGMTGAGKSGVMNTYLAALSACADVELWGIDMKAGLELRPWRPALARFAADQGSAAELLADAERVMHERLAILGDDESRLWVPTPQAPALFVVIDELAELDARRGHLETLARMGRAPRVTLIMATQYPSVEVIPPQVRHQVGVTIALRMARREHMAAVIGAEHAERWSTARFDADTAGLLYAMTSPTDTPRMARGYWLDDLAVKRAARSAVSVRADDDEAPSRIDDDRRPVAALSIGAPLRGTDVVLDVLGDGAEPMAPAVLTRLLAERMGERAPTDRTVRRWLAELEAGGRVCREGDGPATRWRSIRTTGRAATTPARDGHPDMTGSL
jgi:hypothetical protein